MTTEFTVLDFTKGGAVFTTPIGVNSDDLRMAPKQAFRKASEMHFRTIEFGAGKGDLSPKNLTGSGRRHLSRFVEGLGLSIGSLVADWHGLRLTDPLSVDGRVSCTQDIIDLASDLRVGIVTTSLGEVAHPETGEPVPLAVQALRALGEHADARGVLLAVRPTSDNAERTASLLAEVACPAVVVGLDPAAQVMAGHNPLALIELAGGRIPILHVRDGVVGNSERGGYETRLGDGDVDMIGVLAALQGTEFRGPYIVRQCRSNTPVEDLQIGHDRLKQLLSPS